MANVARQSGRTSYVGYAKQAVQGTYVAPTNVIKSETFDANDDPAPVIFETMQGLLDSEDQTRAGVHKVGGKLSSPAFDVQGQNLWKAAIGNDTVPVLTSFGNTSAASTAIGATTVTLLAGAPAVPGGVGEWTGCWATIDTGASAEDFPIFYCPVAGTTINTWPLKKAHNASVAVKVDVQHVLNQNTGTNIATLDYMSFAMQFGRMFERQLLDCTMSHAVLKGDNEKLTYDFDFVSSALLNAETTTLSTLTPATGEAASSPFIQRDGGLATYYSATDSTANTPQMHTRLQSLQYDLTYAIQAEKEGGGAQLSEINVLGKRTQKLVWRENAGQNSGLPDIHTNYVNTFTEIPAWLVFQNAKSGNSMSLWFPRCVVTKFDPVGPSDAPIAYDGELVPLIDTATSGKAVKMCIKNGTTVAM